MRDRSAAAVLRACLLAAPFLCAGCGPSASVQQQSEPLVGLADFHNHQFAYLGFGGSAISHSVDPSASCLPILPVVESFRARDLVRSGLFSAASNQAASGHCFPTITNVASQRVDTDNLKRAWQYGLRLMVMFAVSSEFLCEVGELGPCPSDRDAIELQIRAAKDLEVRIDSIEGGPGNGWYRIVTSAAQARRVVGEGKLAVVLGIEAANAFGCRIRPGRPGMTQVAGVAAPLGIGHTPAERTYYNDCDAPLSLLDPAFNRTPFEFDYRQAFALQMSLALFERYWQQGVRHFYLLHNIDGLAGGTALSINLLHAETNPADIGPGSPLTDRRDEINRVVRAIRPQNVASNCGSKFPYDGGRCNQYGLTEAGRQLAKIMAAHGALIDVDHASWKVRRELLANDGLLGGVYPTISSHSGIAALNHGNANNEGQLANEDVAEIIRAGGAFAPRLPPATQVSDQDTYPANATVARHRCGGTSESFVQVYRYLVDTLRGKKLVNGTAAFVGVGIGTDFGPPLPVFAAPRFSVSGDVTGVTVAGDVSFLKGLFVGGPQGLQAGRCYGSGDGQPMVTYPFGSPLPPGSQFDKSVTPWDGRSSQPGYDVSFDGVVHVGMLPDFVEELRVLGLTDDDLRPLWHGAEAYIRAWESAESWANSFDSEGSKGIRVTCESKRATLLDREDHRDTPGVLAALRELRSTGCRTNP